MNHFTNKSGYDGIRASPTWRFRAYQPPRPEHHPFGAYFTTWPPSTRNLAVRLGIPRSKLEFLFSFADSGDLTPAPGDRGEWIFYSPRDYPVEASRQTYSGRTDGS